MVYLEKRFSPLFKKAYRGENKGRISVVLINDDIVKVSCFEDNRMVKYPSTCLCNNKKNKNRAFKIAESWINFKSLNTDSEIEKLFRVNI